MPVSSGEAERPTPTCWGRPAGAGGVVPEAERKVTAGTAASTRRAARSRRAPSFMVIVIGNVGPRPLVQLVQHPPQSLNQAANGMHTSHNVNMDTCGAGGVSCDRTDAHDHRGNSIQARHGE